MENNKTGFFITGIFKGYRATPWKKDPTKFNHRIGIALLKDDGYGGTTENLIEVDIHSNDIPRVQQIQNDLVSKMVVFRVIPMAKGQNWLSCFMPEGTAIGLAKDQTHAKPANQNEKAA